MVNSKTASLPPGRSPPRRSIGARRNPASQEAILSAAADLIDELGPANFSLEAVAKRAHAGKPTIYRWWPSRVALLMDVYQRWKLSIEFSLGTSVEDDLLLCFDQLLRFWRETSAGATLSLIIAEAQSDEDSRAVLNRFLDTQRHHFVELLDRAEERGEIKGSDERKALFEAASAFVMQRLLLGRLDTDRDSLQAMAALLARGCQPETPRNAD